MKCKIARLVELFLVPTLLLSVTCAQSSAAEAIEDVNVTKTDVNGTVSMISSANRNISVSSGRDGLLIIEDQNTNLSAKAFELLGLLDKDRSAFIIDTRFDYSATNSAGQLQNQGAIIAQESFQDRLENEKTERKPRPIIAYEKELKVYFNDEKISIVHLSAGQTFGDSIVMFGTSNVAYLGHQFWNHQFPFIDLERGETLKSYLLAVAECLSLVSNSMKIIPGHGPLANIADLQDFYRMLNMTSILVKEQMDRGRSREEILERGLGDEWKSWGNARVDEQAWIDILYRAQSE